jgi:hypothetical protein
MSIFKYLHNININTQTQFKQTMFLQTRLYCAEIKLATSRQVFLVLHLIDLSEFLAKFQMLSQ